VSRRQRLLGSNEIVVHLVDIALIETKVVRVESGESVAVSGVGEG
jgi:hypothetical protein